MMRQFQVCLLVAVVVSCVPQTNGYSSGPPTSTCSSMFPGHGVGAQNTPSPYTITLTTNTYERTDSIIIILSGSNTFRGFILQARRTGSTTPIGRFSLFSPDNDIGLMTCPGGTYSDNSIGHTTASVKTAKQFIWTNPEGGDVVFQATFVESRTVFWTNVLSATLVEEQPTTTPEPTTTTTTPRPTTTTPMPTTTTPMPTTTTTSPEPTTTTPLPTTTTPMPTTTTPMPTTTTPMPTTTTPIPTTTLPPDTTTTPPLTTTTTPQTTTVTLQPITPSQPTTTSQQTTTTMVIKVEDTTMRDKMEDTTMTVVSTTQNNVEVDDGSPDGSASRNLLSVYTFIGLLIVAVVGNMKL